jgi:hypothetical protein
MSRAMQIARWLGLSCRSSCNCSRCVLRAYRGEGLLKIRKKQGIYGGRDRDRTCDPYHVKVVLFR